MTTLAHWLVTALEARGLETVFGIPGVHTIELYRGLAGSRLRHVTPRHEQGAGFMADGHARASGRPAACFIITGPGMTNIATAMAQAYADSVPMLVISSVNRRRELGMQEGRLHELPSQQQSMSGLCAFSHTLLEPANLPAVLDRAFAVFATCRPRPVHIEIPRDLFAAECPLPAAGPLPVFHPPGADPAAIEQAAQWLNAADRPLLLLGGGALHDPDTARRLAERLDAPTLTTINARGLLGRAHPLDLGANATWPAVREHAARADVILAIGTELGETDYDVTFDEGFRLTGRLIRVDIDAEALSTSHRPALAMVAEAGGALRALLPRLEQGHHAGAATVASLHGQLALAERADMAPFVPLFEMLDRLLPEAIVVGDSTAPVYAGNHLARRGQVRRWFNASTGYGALGYALPAAIGAALGAPRQPDGAPPPVVALVGDGGLMFTLAELATARDEHLPLIVIVWHNAGYEEIRHAMDAADVPRLGVDPVAPDFAAIAAGFGCHWQQLATPGELAATLSTAAERQDAPWLIEIDATRWPG
ncbi:acetolactate synthase-1/2/3 large subunit [Kushneria sinocarnis]|uniref:Acetolactate synthase-1/2/3 large subunit n=1 Tax=Kushneria sinocarnis TaxID=595502 RepID=A0A420WW49_9GAMM|nr:5-guanidino-2-oxopentanoate decarboxylase [Kushneria sinocarnis]RKR03310.1 acetolactate synthase-1/2/3 large subunit [Kushneria sinocarnis]